MLFRTRALGSVRYLEQATPAFIFQISGHRTVPTFTKWTEREISTFHKAINTCKVSTPVRYILSFTAVCPLFSGERCFLRTGWDQSPEASFFESQCRMIGFRTVKSQRIWPVETNVYKQPTYKPHQRDGLDLVKQIQTVFMIVVGSIRTESRYWMLSRWNWACRLELDSIWSGRSQIFCRT
jgi:hypothetical protein